jgi:hypothetical protein
MSTWILTGGGFQDAQGNPLSFGIITAKLSSDSYANNGTSLVCAGSECEYALDENGNVSTDPAQYIFPNDLLTGVWSQDTDTWCMFAALSEDGQLVWGPNAVSLQSTSAYSLEETTELDTNGVTTVFTLPDVPVTSSLIVYTNGLAMTPGVDYTLASATITFTTAPASSETVVADYYVGTGSIVPTFANQAFSSGSTVYTLSSTPVSGTVKVFQGGSLQSPDGVTYSITGTTIAFNMATTRPVWVIYQTSAGAVDSSGQFLTGIQNGVNRTFELNSTATVTLFVNGIRQDGSGYTQVGSTIIFDVAPPSWYQLYCCFDSQQFISLTDIIPSNPA